MTTIGVVIVTYNRLDKLKETLKLFDAQTVLPEYIVLVDNASTDGTVNFIDEWASIDSGFNKIVVKNSTNLGGSGGFYTALEKAVELSADWIWVSDDDAFPEQDAIEQAEVYLEKHKDEQKKIAAICGTVINQGKIDLEHRRRAHVKGLRVIDEFVSEQEYEKDAFTINCFSYVGAIINKDKLGQAGLTRKDYFIWYDDTEHSLRLSKQGEIRCVPAIKLHHDVGTASSELNWKFYYSFRNRADLLREHFPIRCYRWYRFVLLLKAGIKGILGKDKEKNRLIKEAMKDAKEHRFGIHDVYKPGWKPGE